jgi:hypothetical protein
MKFLTGNDLETSESLFFSSFFTMHTKNDFFDCKGTKKLSKQIKLLLEYLDIDFSILINFTMVNNPTVFQRR